MKVKELMRTRNLLSVEEDDDLALAQQIMAWGGVRHLPVLRHGQLVGIITERDILRYRAETGGTGALDPVKQYMSHPVETIAPEDDIAQASAVMVAKRIGCLPVVDEGQVVGIVTRSDLLASHIAAARPSGPPREPGRPAAVRPAALTAGAAMRRETATVYAYQPVLEAVGIMVDRGIRHVTVIDDDRRVVGIISDRDVRTAIGDPHEALHAELERLEEMRVSGVMSAPVLTAHEETPLTDVAKRFVDERIGAIPIVDRNHRLVGIVSYVDVIRTLQRAVQGAQEPPPA